METATAESATAEFAYSPIRVGLFVGLSLAVCNRLLHAFDLWTLGVGFLVVGVCLATFAEGSWPDVGRALAATGGAGVVAFELLSLVLG